MERKRSYPNSKGHEKEGILLPHIKEPGGREGRILRLVNSAARHHLGQDCSLLSAQPPSGGDFLPDARMTTEAPTSYDFLILNVQEQRGRGQSLPFAEQGSPSLAQISLHSTHLITKFHPMLNAKLIVSKENE